METNRQAIKADTSEDTQSKKRKQPTNGHTDNTVNLSETTTVDDISTMDVSTYLAWVNRQAKSLPNVFVATTSSTTQDDNTSIDHTTAKEQTHAAKEGIGNGSKEKKEEEEPFHGSRTTLQILLSKRMDILPPPTVKHLPPPYNSTTSMMDDDDIKMSVTATEGEECSDNNINSNKSSSWVSNTIANFSQLRSYLETERTKQQSQQQGAAIRKIAVPRMKDRAAWHIFCLGREEAYGNVGGYYEEEEEDDDSDKERLKKSKKDETGGILKEDESDKVQPNGATEVVTQQQSSSQTTKLIYNPSNIPTQGYTPQTSLILQFDQVLTRTLFHHHVHYLCEWKFTLSYNRCVWIYTLLSNMEKPLHIDEVCGVRRVLRECCLRRWELKLPNDDNNEEYTKQSAIDESISAREERDVKKATGSYWEQLALLNTLIAITGIYFEQGNAAASDCMDSLFTVKPVDS